MTSVQSHLLLLSGNRYQFLVLLCLLISACSPKVQQAENKPAQVGAQKKVIEAKPVEKFTQAKIALLVPFRLESVNLRTATKADVDRSAMAIDFYQGFKLGVDSAASSGLNFTLNVHDTGDSQAQLERIITTGQLRSANLIVGPVFPDGLRHLKNYSVDRGIPIVNPLAATHPAEFNNPNLISIVNNINQHAAKIVNYIVKRYDPANTVVVLISRKDPDDEIMATPLRMLFLSKGSKFSFQEYASVFTMETKLIKQKKYVVIVSSSARDFVAPTIDKLVKMKNVGLNVDLYGHPDWVKQNYTVDKLQLLRTAVTSSYRVNYTDPRVNQFVKKYRALYQFEPDEFAFKGFDIGFYFGKMLSKYGTDYAKHLSAEKYTGLHNRFVFDFDEALGYMNTSLMLLRYQNYQLSELE
ncbi:ABC transporter substrate-binding protein [Pedobacter deserti]|uniref:ABC transporter substrate-binding protein n=1 Tax=Pedobacter deserti TaxID=2817382 RepID=UPI00210A2CEC|nr:ABC transporter substrate-binding protein [Pedobacter sp. SYSU D00382]